MIVYQSLNQKINIDDLLRQKNIDIHNWDDSRKLQYFKAHYKEFFPNSDSFYADLRVSSSGIYVYQQKDYTKSNDYFHNHSFYEIIFCQNGHMQYLIHDKHYPVSSGDIVIIPPGVSHQPFFIESENGPFTRMIIHASAPYIEVTAVSGTAVKKLFAEIKENHHYVIQLKHSPYEKYLELFSQLLEERNNEQSGWELYVSSIFFQILCILIRAFESDSRTIVISEKEALIDRVLKYIHEHMTEKISLQSVAKEFLVSTSTISHLFKTQLNTSFYQLVIQYRLNEAKNLLLTDYPVTNIPESVGFQDYATFYRAFKKEFSVSPTSYRKHLQNHSLIVSPDKQ